eukprot:TRINITY_DN3571_c0_g1_i4.p1 TRINITY_DN3571_c0_g1~~TRINITY_DN3571_c0_g1_i4.p1  ORF type:complete len:139 (-),score=28.64 TRINITY_DN3571_c0_g1_i4:174-590(-)
MAKNAGDVLLEQAFKKPALLKANAKEEVKCEDFSNILYRWMIQIGRGKSAITKMQPPQNNPGAAAANPEPARPSLSGSKGMSAAKFWETMKMSKVGQKNTGAARNSTAAAPKSAAPQGSGGSKAAPSETFGGENETKD